MLAEVRLWPRQEELIGIIVELMLFQRVNEGRRTGLPAEWL